MRSTLTPLLKLLLLGSSLLAAACDPNQGLEAHKQGLLETNKALVRRVYDEAYSGGRVELVDELLSPEYVNHQVFPGLPAGREGIKMVIGAMRTAFPDMYIEIHDMVAEGELVYVRATIRGTHLGPLNGMQASGKQVAFDTIDTFRLVNGLQVEHWGVTDQLSLIQQISPSQH